MTDLFKKAALFNAELISIGAEKLKEVADDFVRQGILNDQEARRFVVDVREKLTSRERDLDSKLQRISKAGQELFKEFRLAPKAEPEQIDGRIGELEKQLDDLRNRKDALKLRNGQGKKDALKKDEILA